MLCGEPLIESEADALEVPGQQLGDAIDGMIGDALDDVPQISFGIEAVGLGSFDQAVNRCGAQPPASDPAKVQLRRPRAIGRMARSAAELSMQARPSRRINVSASQRARL